MSYLGMFFSAEETSACNDNKPELKITCDDIEVDGSIWTLSGSWLSYNFPGQSDHYNVAIKDGVLVLDSTSNDSPDTFKITKGPEDYIGTGDLDDMNGTWSNEIDVSGGLPASLSAILYHAEIGDAESAICNFSDLPLPVIENEPICGDGIINQANGIEQCDGNSFPSGYETGFTCDNSCKIKDVTSVCTLDAESYDYIVNLNNKKLVSDSSSGYPANTPAHNVSFPDGTYSITLQAHDAYYGRSGANQLNEQYKLSFFGSGGLLVATSNPNTDLDDDVNYVMITEEVNTALQLTGVKTVSGVHAYYHNDDTGATSPNSVDAVCFGLKKVESQEPSSSCGDGVINQTTDIEQCDGNSFPSGYETGFTCNNKCQIEAVAPVCTLDEDDYDYIVNFQNIKLVSNDLSLPGFASSTSAYNVSLPDGKYSVTLQAHDAYYTRSEEPHQKNEQYQLTFFNEAGLPVATSSPHVDLAPDTVNYVMITEEVNTALQLTGVKTVSGVHAYYNTIDGAKSPNSVNPICAGLNFNEDGIGGGDGDEIIKLAPSFSYAGLQCLNVGSGVEINFTNTSSSTSGYNLMWNFGDNATSTQANPSHTYTAAGSYNVALTLTSTSTSTSTPVTATATSTIAITNCNINGGGSGGGGGGGGTYSGGGGSGVISFAISNTQVTMMCVNDKVNMNISWLTTNPATSRVVYDKNSHAAGNIGLAPNYNYASSTVLYSNNVTGHNVSVNGLEPNTFYYFRPISVYNSIENVGQEKPLTQTLSCGPGSSEVIVLGEEGAPTITIDSDFLVNFTNPGATGVDYRIIVKNNGDLPSYETVLNSLLPEDITFQDGGLASKMWNLGDIGVGETKVIMTKVNVSAEAEAKTYIAKASVYSANHDEVNSETDLDVRKIAVLAETGFSNLQFIALLGLIVLIFGARIFLLKNRKRKPILVKKTI